MSDIAPLAGPSYDRIQPYSGPGRDQAVAVDGRVERPSDRVDISDRARLLSRLAALPEVRQDLVDRVRRELEEGTYESPEKLEEALLGLSEDLEL